MNTYRAQQNIIRGKGRDVISKIANCDICVTFIFDETVKIVTQNVENVTLM